MKPLAGLIVLDFSQFLAGPAAAMRLRPQEFQCCLQT